jgi:hypothetical protein
MVRIATIAFLAAAALAAPAAQARQAATPSARLEVMRERPAVIRGERFKAGERVTILLRTTETWVRRATANDRGVLTVRFAVSLPECGRYSLHAFGSKGSRARSLAGRTICDEPNQ